MKNHKFGRNGRIRHSKLKDSRQKIGMLFVVVFALLVGVTILFYKSTLFDVLIENLRNEEIALTPKDVPLRKSKDIQPLQDNGFLALPVDCIEDNKCFVHRIPDVDPSGGIRDPFGTDLAYQDNKSVGFEVRSVAELGRGILVKAVADGHISSVNFQHINRLPTPKERKEGVDNPWGNFVRIDHGNGYQSGYFKMSSFGGFAKAGQVVKAGDPLGYMGYSGNSRRPGLSFYLWIDGVQIEPIFGRPMENHGTLTKLPRFDPIHLDKFRLTDGYVEGMGLAAHRTTKKYIRQFGYPKEAQSDAQSVIPWVWYERLRKGDVIEYKIIRPDGTIIERRSVQARYQMGYWLFHGDRFQTTIPGSYVFETNILRAGKSLKSTKHEAHFIGRLKN